MSITFGCYYIIRMLRTAVYRVQRGVQVARRNMSGGAFDEGPHEPPNAKGRIQEVFKISAGYVVIILAATMLSGGKKKPSKHALPAPTPAPVSTSAVPSVDDPSFGDWLSGPGNIEKLFA